MKKILLIISLSLLWAGCHKDDDDDVIAPVNLFRFIIQYEIDGMPLNHDSMMYFNEAGNNFSVHSLAYYITQLTFVKEDNSMLELKAWHYADSKVPGTNSLTIQNIPEGCYKEVRFNIGVDPAHNIADGLPATAENLSMEWPAIMGGGYHFLKLEGYFADSSGQPGFAMHLGTNPCLVNISIPVSICISGTSTEKTLVMNVNEWFKNPSPYDFNTDGNNIMGNPAAMLKLARNGVDVFQIK